MRTSENNQTWKERREDIIQEGLLRRWYSSKACMRERVLGKSQQMQRPKAECGQWLNTQGGCLRESQDVNVRGINIQVYSKQGDKLSSPTKLNVDKEEVEGLNPTALQT